MYTKQNMPTCSIYNMSKCSTGKLWRIHIDTNIICKVVDCNTRLGPSCQNDQSQGIVSAKQLIIKLCNSSTTNNHLNTLLQGSVDRKQHSEQWYIKRGASVPWMSNKRANSTRQSTINPVVFISLDQTCWTVGLCHAAHWG